MERSKITKGREEVLAGIQANNIGWEVEIRMPPASDTLRKEIIIQLER